MNFFSQVYEVVEHVPKGKVVTYGQIAKFLGHPRSSRQVGYALHVNPKPIVTPCHRVVNRNGQLSGAFAFGGSQVQQKLLEDEGVKVKNNTVDLKAFGFNLDDLI